MPPRRAGTQGRPAHAGPPGSGSDESAVGAMRVVEVMPVGRLALERRVGGRDALGVDAPDIRPVIGRHGLDTEWSPAAPIGGRHSDRCYRGTATPTAPTREGQGRARSAHFAERGSKVTELSNSVQDPNPRWSATLVVALVMPKTYTRPLTITRVSAALQPIATLPP